MDFWVSAPDLPTLDAVAQQIDGLWVPATDDIPGHIAPQLRLDDGTEWVWSLWGPWNKPTGEVTTDPSGFSVPVTENDGRIYGIARWNGDVAKIPFATAGGMITVDPDTGATTITAGPVTMISPLPADCPVTF